MELLLWDFFGPRAERTAEHFKQHLEEFATNNALQIETFLTSEGEGHQAVACRAPDEHVDGLVRALRPQRRMPPS